MLGHRFSDRGIEAAVQRMKLLHTDRRLLFDRELRHRLADVAIVMDDLATLTPANSSSAPCSAAAEPIASLANGDDVPSSRSVSANCVRNKGTPCSSSRPETAGHGRLRTRSRAR